MRRAFRALPCLLVLATGLSAAPRHVGLLQEAAQAVQTGDTATALANLEEAAQLRPDYPRIQLNLARVYAQTGRSAGAIGALQRLAEMGLQRDVAAEPAFASMLARPDFQAVAARLLQGPATVPPADTPAVSLPVMSGIIEGVLHDTSTDLWYFSDVRHRCIWKFDPDSGGVTRFTAEADALDGVFKLALSADRKTLWASTAAIGVMTGPDAEDGKRSALVAIDFQTGRVRERYPVPADGRKHLLGDFCIAKDGTVIATDSFSPVIWRLTPGGSALEPWLEHEDFLNLQGLAFSSDGQTLHVADYSNGIWQINVANRQVVLLRAPANASFFGIDGLYPVGADLLAIQNGLEPQRILRITPGAKDTPAAVTVLALDPRSLTDLALGTLDGDSLCFVANSGWALYDPAPAQPPSARTVHILGFTVR